MIHSMTGYGKASISIANTTIQIELKSLNSKSIDMRTRLPRDIQDMDLPLRKVVSERLLRGKIDLNVELNYEEDQEQSSILNISRLTSYAQKLKQVKEDLNLDSVDILNAVLKLPNVLDLSSRNINDEVRKQLLTCLDNALIQIENHRLEEGKSIFLDLKQSAQNILRQLESLDPLDANRLENIRQRMDQTLSKYLSKETKDESRFEQELIFYAERLDINEEKVRLKQHCNYFLEYLEDSDLTLSKGKKLGFISQEIGREINTLGAKAYNTEIQKIVIGMKNDLEQMKEQIANVL